MPQTFQVSSQACSRNNGLCYHGDRLVSGPLEALIGHLLPTPEYYPDRTYVFTFLLSSRLFLQPQQLLQRLSEHLTHQGSLEGVASRLLRLLSEWSQSFPCDFRDQHMMHCLKHLNQRLLRTDQVLRKGPRSRPEPRGPRPALGGPRPAPGGPRPAPGDPRPAPGGPRPAPGGPRPALEGPRPALEGPRPAPGGPRPALEGPRPAPGGPRPVLGALLRRLSVLGEYEQALGQIPAAALERLPPRRDPPPELTRSTPSTWAQQLTLIELERLSYVGPEEFVQVFMSRGGGGGSEKGGGSPSKTPFLDAYVDWFNRLSSLVATEICLPEKKKQRAQVLDFFIDAAQECLNIGNFNSLMAVMSGMSTAPVSRLRRTWSRVNTDKFHILERLMDPSCNFYNYRTALRGAQQRSLTARSSHGKMVIPFFSLSLKDLYFLNEGCSTRLANGHVNFQKCWELAKRVSEFMSWRRTRCPFEKERPILQYLLTTPTGRPDALCRASFEREAPENNMDRQQWKSLRSSSRIKSKR